MPLKKEEAAGNQQPLVFGLLFSYRSCYGVVGLGASANAFGTAQAFNQ